MDLEEAVQLEKQLHPYGTRQDLYKLIVQACLGNGHLMTSPEDSFQALQKEKRIAGKDSLQEIGNGFIRVPLSYMKEEDLLLWNELFIESAKKRSTRRIFDQALKTYGFEILDKTLYDTRADVISICRCSDLEKKDKLLLFRDRKNEQDFMKTNVFKMDNYKVIHSLEGCIHLDDVILPIQNRTRHPVSYELLYQDLAELKAELVISRHKR